MIRFRYAQTSPIAPGTLHHVMARGIERTEIFRNPDDQNDFINRLVEPCRKGDMIIYAWALMSNHFLC